jgi:predicted DNA-binding transcriptional regulator AlpA
MENTQANVIGRRCSSVDQFCADHGISRAMFYKICAAGKGPRVMKIGSRTLISEEAASEWRRSMEDRPAA